jgi:hypothetical protein
MPSVVSETTGDARAGPYMLAAQRTPSDPTFEIFSELLLAYPLRLLSPCSSTQL